MKKILFILIIALFAFTTMKTEIKSTTYLDFDDIEYPEVVVV